MKNFVLALCAVALIAIFADNAHARRGGGMGGNSMLCNNVTAATAAPVPPAPVQATPTNLTQTVATKIVAPSDCVVKHSAPVLEGKQTYIAGKFRVDVNALSAMNAPPLARPAAANVATK